MAKLVWCRSLRLPEPRREFGLLVAARVSIDGRGADARVTHPFLHHVEGNGSSQCADAETVGQPADQSWGRRGASGAY